MSPPTALQQACKDTQTCMRSGDRWGQPLQRTQAQGKGHKAWWEEDTAPLKWPMDQGFREEGPREEWGAQMGCRQGRAG